VARRTRRGRSYKVFWTISRVRRAVAVGFVVWIVVAFAIPLPTYGKLLGTEKLATSGTYTLDITGLPPVRYSANISYSAVGAFSVGAGNPIFMKATVYDVNRSDFTAYFNGIGLLYQDVPVAYVAGSSVVLLPHLRPAGSGRWTIDASVVFAKQINFTGPVLALVSSPANVSASEINSEVTRQVKAYSYPFPTLQPQSYTNQLVAQESGLKYAAMASAVVLILLLPVFYRVLLPREAQEGPA
jgi:hypothetical protein